MYKEKVVLKKGCLRKHFPHEQHSFLKQKAFMSTSTDLRRGEVNLNLPFLERKHPHVALMTFPQQLKWLNPSSLVSWCCQTWFLARQDTHVVAPAPWVCRMREEDLIMWGAEETGPHGLGAATTWKRIVQISAALSDQSHLWPQPFNWMEEFQDGKNVTFFSPLFGRISPGVKWTC